MGESGEHVKDSPMRNLMRIAPWNMFRFACDLIAARPLLSRPKPSTSKQNKVKQNVWPKCLKQDIQNITLTQINQSLHSNYTNYHWKQRWVVKCMRVFGTKETKILRISGRKTCRQISCDEGDDIHVLGNGNKHNLLLNAITMLQLRSSWLWGSKVMIHALLE